MEDLRKELEKIAKERENSEKDILMRLEIQAKICEDLITQNE